MKYNLRETSGKPAGLCGKLLLVVCLGVALLSCDQKVPEEISEDYQKLPEKIDFNYHVKPILSDKCYHCHGPDQNSRKANLRLDTEEGAFASLREGGHAFVAGSLSKSIALQRILSADSGFRMPPPGSNLSLSKQEMATLIKWVEQGAEFKKHWSFIPPEKADVPDDLPSGWKAVNEIDHFIQERLQSQGLQPAPEADKERLLRRVTMDLTGLPPSLEEMDAFLKDDSDVAYEKVVDRLLATDAHAERLAMEWLDVARYADSHGMHADGYRLMWPWRDWVIRAFRKNMPYNEFVTWQLAGDLMPNPTRDQILATAFNRNHPMTDEGGVIDEEFRLKYVEDRTSTAGTAFLGLTLECASCHDHKFDPVSQKEFYQMSAFFNNVKELGMTGADGNYGPNLLLTDSATEVKIAEIRNYIQQKETRLAEQKAKLRESARMVVNTSLVKGSKTGDRHYPLESFRALDTSAYCLDVNRLTKTKVAPVLMKGKVGNAMKFTGEYDELQLLEAGLFESYDPFSGGAWINTTKKEPGKTQTIFGNTGQKNNFWRGWDFFLDQENRVNVRLVSSLPHNYFHVASTDTVTRNEWTHVFFTYDGSSRAAGVRIYINGRAVKATTQFDRLYKTIYPVRLGTFVPEKRPLAVGKSYRLHTGEFGIFKGLMDEIRLYERELSPYEIKDLYRRESGSLVEVDYSDEELKEYLAARDPRIVELSGELRELRKQLVETMNPVDEVMVMEEMPQPRKTFVLERGLYDSPGEEVQPGTPEYILPYPKDLPPNRLGFAQWIFDPKNPLTARVTVNRYWQMIFGRGLVKTSNDFGNQGSLPSHPELLDWLAVDFMESGWDVRGLLKKMVMSATYRQSSVASPEVIEIDPENILLARSPSYRWPAEMIRDNALAASGLLVREVGGRSVKPYQPELWRELSNYSRMLLYYKPDTGKDLYRRSMYTFIRRTSPPPFMTIFDAPNRDVCTVSRERTNTPLQALVLLNDPQFVEASKAFAERILTSGEKDLYDQITHAFRLATGRKPVSREVEILGKLFTSEKDRFAKDPKETEGLLSIGEYQVSGKLPRADVAAMTIVANTILNHDEAYMKR